MVIDTDYRRFPILYVDDEAQALKYFRKALEKDFEIITAENVAAAREILNERGDEIGILVCDQRMPGEKGTDLLASVRSERPGIIRVLTTAYSDLESAIEAVNTGAIYKYIVKPWDVRDLRGVLLRAMDFFVVQRQRDALLNEKLSVLQRMMVADRVRSLAVLAAGLSHHIRNSMSALKEYLDLAPNMMQPETDAKGDASHYHDAWEAAQNESKHLMELAENISNSVTQPDQSFDTFVTPTQLIEDAVGRSDKKIELKPTDEMPELKVNRGTVDRMLDVLLAKSSTLNRGEGTLTVKLEGPLAVWGTPGVKVTIHGEGQDWKRPPGDVLSTNLGNEGDPLKDQGMELLSAFFIANHHGGDVRFVGGEDSPHFELTLPNDPLAAERPPTDPNFLDDLFEMFELQQLNA